MNAVSATQGNNYYADVLSGYADNRLARYTPTEIRVFRESASLIESQAATITALTECKDKLADQNRRLIRRNSDLADRERAAVHDIKLMMKACRCACLICADGDCENAPDCDPKWRGPVDAGKGETK